MMKIVSLPLFILLLSACGSKKIYIKPQKQPLPQEFKQKCRVAKELMEKPQTQKQIAELIIRQNAELKNCEAKRAGLVRIYEK